jgi:hypothetical protein
MFEYIALKIAVGQPPIQVLTAKAPYAGSCQYCFGADNPQLCGPFPCTSRSLVMVEDTPEGRARHVANLLEK